MSAVFLFKYSRWFFWNFLTNFLDFMKDIEWFKMAKTEDLVKRLDEVAQKIIVVATVVFTLIDVKGESGSKTQQTCYFCYDHFFDSS